MAEAGQVGLARRSPSMPAMRPANPRQHQVLGLEQEAVTDKGAGRHAHQDTAAVKATTAMAAMVTPESKRIVSKRSTAAA